MTPLLLVEDDESVSSFLSEGLSAEGYTVDVCTNGNSALQIVTKQEYPILIMDRVLPDADGIHICTSLRDIGYNGHIIILTAKASVSDRIKGLRCGADDYMSKPFDFQELLARLEALQRREARKSIPFSQTHISVGPLQLNLETHKVMYLGNTIALTKREFELLNFLMENNDKIVSRTQILQKVWGYNFEPGTKLVEVYIRYLRKKLDQEGQPSLIESLRGIGYRLKL
ncbi:MAG: response regulator transcription factor [Methyloligellaceae bacterium]